MSFVSELNALPGSNLADLTRLGSASDIPSLLHKADLSLADFARLISPGAGEHLEELCHRAQVITRQRFGKVIRLFAPLYLCNECINKCRYCGFSEDNPILRVTLAVDELLPGERAVQ